MARSKRQTQWIDTIQSAVQSIAGAVAPGTIDSNVMILESEAENVGGGGTVSRIVGDIWVARTAGAPVVTATVMVFDTYVGAALPTDWDNDTFQRRAVMWTAMWVLNSTTDGFQRRTLDVRTKRKLGQGQRLTLEIQNHGTAGNDAQFAFHLRSLLLLP